MILEKIRLIMTNNKLNQHIAIPLQSGFKFRFFQTGGEQIWPQIMTEAQEFPNLKKARLRFLREFQGHQAQLFKRCLFLVTEQNEPVGTAMSWYDPCYLDGLFGRLHWVSVIPPYQDLGLGKLLVSQALEVMKQYHSKAYLATQVRNYKAIKIYFGFGFRPHLEGKEQLRRWKKVEQTLGFTLLP